MASELPQRLIEIMHVEAAETIPQLNWTLVLNIARGGFASDLGNSKSLAFVAPRPHLLSTAGASPTTAPHSYRHSRTQLLEQTTSFAVAAPRLKNLWRRKGRTTSPWRMTPRWTGRWPLP